MKRHLRDAIEYRITPRHQLFCGASAWQPLIERLFTRKRVIVVAGLQTRAFDFGIGGIHAGFVATPFRAPSVFRRSNQSPPQPPGSGAPHPLSFRFCLTI
jgi:hypothetical protein